MAPPLMSSPASELTAFPAKLTGFAAKPATAAQFYATGKQYPVNAVTAYAITLASNGTGANGIMQNAGGLIHASDTLGTVECRERTGTVPVH